MNDEPEALARRVADRWREREWGEEGTRVVVAVSGGLDSLVLLHLLRFPLASLDLRLTVAHFDHAMRGGSAADARWVRGLAEAWQLPVRWERSEVRPENEAEARALRYAFLHRIRRQVDADFLVTAHHADDQVETVLFRILRGTGVRGLAGIAASRTPGVVRPLLEESRRELEIYAARMGFTGRSDPTNRELHPARNRIRHELLPRLESIHPGARSAILRLARNARRTHQALDLLLEPILAQLIEDRGPGSITVARDPLLAYPFPVRSAIFRALAREAGVTLDEAGTGAALEFISHGVSGGRLQLPGSVRLARDFDRVRLEWGTGRALDREGRPEEADAPFTLPAPEPAGRTLARLAGRPVVVAWGTSPPEAPEGAVEAFHPGRLDFPLMVRRWRPGDRTSSPAGRRKLKKLFGELRLSVDVRRRIPVVADGRDEVIWIPGWHRAPVARPRNDETIWYLGVWYDDENT